MVTPLWILPWLMLAAPPGAPVDAPPDDAAALEPERAPARVKPKLITPAIVAAAEVFLSEAFHAPYGTERETEVAGHRYVFVLEPHYHPPFTVGAPSGWHKGVTVYEAPPAR